MENNNFDLSVNSYINNIITKHIGDGYYWTDKYDNYKKEDWFGIYKTSELAMEAGKNFRIEMLKTNFKGKFYGKY